MLERNLADCPGTVLLVLHDADFIAALAVEPIVRLGGPISSPAPI